MILITGFAPFGGDTTNPSSSAARAAVDTLNSTTPAAFIEVPVVFRTAGPTVLAEIARLNALHPHDPVSIVICAGLAGNRKGLSLETTAVNLQDARIPDNAGEQPRGTPVIPEKPTPGDRPTPAGGAGVQAEATPAPTATAQPQAQATQDVKATPTASAAAEPNSGATPRDGARTLASRLPLPSALAALKEASIPAALSDDAGLYVCNALFYYTLHEVPADVQVGFVHVPSEKVLDVARVAEGLVVVAKAALAAK